MAFDPEKVERWKAGPSLYDFTIDSGGCWVHAADYEALLNLYRQLAVSEANLKFLRASDDAIETEQAHTIQRLENSAPWNRNETK